MSRRKLITDQIIPTVIAVTVILATLCGVLLLKVLPYMQ